jgi:hypothetical protein
MISGQKRDNAGYQAHCISQGKSMKTTTLIAIALLSAAPAFAEDQEKTACDPGKGITFQLMAGASITGPVTLTSTSGTTVQPDGTKRTDSLDELTVSEGKTIYGPATFCTRTVSTDSRPQEQKPSRLTDLPRASQDPPSH